MSIVVKIAIGLVVLVVAARVAATLLEIAVLPPPARAAVFVLLAGALLAVAVWAWLRTRRHRRASR